ncbi:Rop family plasmid primer RNA-binding protein (plasmid) [Klebsiella quasipneumoniae]|nr:Rop family plasmid primer RNA-binding protein [Klebsiella quasipneumoniae]
MVATGSTLEEANGQKAALNMAKFIKGQSWIC